MKTTTLIKLSLIGIMPIFLSIIGMFVFTTTGIAGYDMNNLNYPFLLVIAILAIFGFAPIMTLLLVQSREGEKLNKLDDSSRMYDEARGEMEKLKRMYIKKLEELNK